MNKRIGPAAPPHSHLSRIAAGVVQRIGFWVSVLLPAAYLPVLYALEGQTKLLTIVGLVVVNVLCLAVGHRHRS